LERDAADVARERKGDLDNGVTYRRDTQ
jgi:hypothetical protein